MTKEHEWARECLISRGFIECEDGYWRPESIVNKLKQKLRRHKIERNNH